MRGIVPGPTRRGSPPWWRAAVAVTAALGLLAVPGTERRPGGPTGTPASGSSTSRDGGTPATSAPPTTAPPPRSFTLVATGDVLLHSPLWAQAEEDAAAEGGTGFDFRPLLAGVKPLVSGADVAICHLETPLAPAGGPYHGYPSFSVPPEIAGALADTGYDACSTASNHTFDQGAAGVDRTLADLDAAGIRHAGSARSPEEAAVTTVLTVAGARVALLSYAYGFNGRQAPDGQVWRANVIDEARILADAARARREGADVVVVALHWGDEYQADPSAQQSIVAPDLIRSPDIDLLLGHHAHVVQPLQSIGGEWVVYGMGNLVANHGTRLPANAEGLLVRFTFTEGPAGWHVTRAEYAPLFVTAPGPPIRVVDVGAALATGAAPASPARLQEAWDRTTATVGALGAFAAGLQPMARP